MKRPKPKYSIGQWVTFIYGYKPEMSPVGPQRIAGRFLLGQHWVYTFENTVLDANEEWITPIRKPLDGIINSQIMLILLGTLAVEIECWLTPAYAQLWTIIYLLITVPMALVTLALITVRFLKSRGGK